MSNISYSFSPHTNPSSPEQLLYISASSYEKDWGSVLHAHSFTELFYVMEGEGDFLVEDQKSPIRKDHLIIINPNIRHTERSSDSSRLSYIVLGIDHLKFNFSGERQADSYGIFDMVLLRNIIVPILRDMIDELRRKSAFHEEICHHYLSILLMKITRITGSDVDLFLPENIPAECERAKAYMDSHYQQKITLDSLAQIAHWDKYYFAHIFSQTYGISPICYLQQRRLLRSQELLKSTDLSITQIASSTGFSSQSYFSQMFRKLTGLSPRKYREIYGGG